MSTPWSRDSVWRLTSRAEVYRFSLSDSLLFAIALRTSFPSGVLETVISNIHDIGGKVGLLEGVLLIGGVVLQLLITPAIRAVTDLCVPLSGNGSIEAELGLPVDVALSLRLKWMGRYRRRWRILVGILLLLVLSFWLTD